MASTIKERVLLKTYFSSHLNLPQAKNKVQDKLELEIQNRTAYRNKNKETENTRVRKPCEWFSDE